MNPLDALSWIIAGMIAGWMVSLIMKSSLRGGFVIDMLMGILGAMLAGLTLTFASANATLVAGAVAAFLGAFLLVSLPRVLYALTH